MRYIAAIFAVSAIGQLGGSLAASLPPKVEPRQTAAAPQVAIPGLATFRGSSTSNVDSFRGIPFALPPLGNLRLRPPQPFNQTLTGIQDATQNKQDCPQQFIGNYALPPGIAHLLGELEKFLLPSSQQSEDCLYLNVYRPAGIKEDAKLPVMMWIFGGGFEFGGISRYDPTPIIQQSINMNQPVIWIAANYRVSGFGFMPGRQIRDQGAGNIGLRDQRLAMHWVQQNIKYFGGDPTKVTLFGESAGAISIGLQLFYNGGVDEKLFRGFIAESGSPIPVGNLSLGQAYFDNVVSRCGCTKAADQVQCLREVDYGTFSQAVASNPGIVTNYRSLALAYVPRVDGDTLRELPQEQARKGNFVKVPAITGDNTDEGTLFAGSASNVTTDAQFKDYLKGYFRFANDTTLQKLLNVYPADPSQGSPFGTGTAYAISPQYKRIAAILGDLVFQAPRRFIMGLLVGAKVPVWTYRFNHVILPQLGCYHGSEISSVYGAGTNDTTSLQMRATWISFVNTLDPNNHNLPSLNIPYWPQYTPANKSQILFDVQNTTISADTYRAEAMQTIIDNIDALTF